MTPKIALKNGKGDAGCTLNSTELMSWSSVHFMQAIKGGVVEKICNIDTYKRPAFRFKKIDAIYKSEDASSIDSRSTVILQDKGFRGSSLGCNRIKIEMPPQSMVDRSMNVGHQTCELNGDGIINDNDGGKARNGGESERNNDYDDLRFSDMTIKELKLRCRAKKQKVLKSVDFTKPDLESHPTLNDLFKKRKPAHEDESDLDKPLIILKMKVSKKCKPENKLVDKHICSYSPESMGLEEIPTEQKIISSTGDQCPIAGSVVNELIIRGHSLQNTGYLCGLTEIKNKIPEPDSVGQQNVACVADRSTPNCGTKMDFHDKSGADVDEKLDGGECDTEAPTASVQKSLHCSINEISTEYLVPGTSSSPTNISDEIYGETTKLPCLEMTSDKFSPSPVSEVKMENVSTLQISAGSPETISAAMFPASEMYDIYESSSPQQEETSWLMHDTATTIDHTRRVMELNNVSYGCISDMEGECLRKLIDEVKKEREMPAVDISDVDPTPDVKDHCTIEPDGRFTLTHTGFTAPDSFHSVDDGSPTTEEKLPCITEEMVSTTVDEARDYSTEVCPSNASEGFITTEALEYHHSGELDHHPKKLLSTRKVIAPTSQEKLCQAVDADELYDSIKLSRGLEEAEMKVSLNSKNDENGSPPSGIKSILKSSPISYEPLSGSPEVSKIHPRAQEAIKFSQRQMHDIDVLAAKLLKGLKSMRNIVEETLGSAECSPMPSKYTADEMRVAAENAVELERTTKKWLTMMSKDCNRFCKIMRPAEKKATTVSVIPKERKKITFADEAGGILCQVKVFEEPPASVMASASEC